MKPLDLEDDWQLLGHRSLPDSGEAVDGDPLAAPAAAPQPFPTAEPILVQIDGRSWRWTLAAYHPDDLGHEPVACFETSREQGWPDWWEPLDRRSFAALEDARAEVEAARPVCGDGRGEE